MIHNGSTPRRFVFGNNDANERIVPEEYKYNSSMINELIKQNKDLHKQITEKQEEIDRLNVLIGSFRAKLIKYTELNKKMQQDQQEQQHNRHQSFEAKPRHKSEFTSESSSPVSNERDSEYLQIKKNNRHDESKIDDIYQKLELLTNLVNDAIHKQNNGEKREPSNFNSRIVSDDDIIISESQEFKQLQDQIDLLKRKLLIKKENELRKLSLNKELADLMDELSMNSSPSTNQNIDPYSEVSSRPKSGQQRRTNEDQQSLHCEHCHLKTHTQSHPSEPRFVNLKESLETPTPTPNQTPRKLKREKDTNVADKQYSLW
ncbi:Spc42 [Kluyveromyces lactis]|nr:Spc42 [Kluyveromyces lactis]